MNPKQHEELKLAIAIARDELDLYDVKIKIKLVTRIGVHGTMGDTDKLGARRYEIRLALTSGDLVTTLGHELYHVYQFENELKIDCDKADMFGFELAAEIEWQVARC